MNLQSRMFGILAAAVSLFLSACQEPQSDALPAADKEETPAEITKPASEAKTGVLDNLQKMATEKAADDAAAGLQDKLGAQGLSVQSIAGMEKAIGALKTSFSGNDQVKQITSGLLGSMVDKKWVESAKALSSLSQMDFSKEQIPAYASLLKVVGPVLLSQVFETSGENANPMVVKAIELMKKEDLSALASQLTKLGDLSDLSALQSGVLNNLIKSYAPVIGGIDTQSVINVGAGLLKQVGDKPADVAATEEPSAPEVASDPREEPATESE